MDDNSHRHTSPGDITPILVPRRQGRISSPGPLPSLLNPESWFCPYGLNPFLDALSKDGDGKDLEASVILVKSTITNENEWSTLQNRCSRFGKVVSYMSLFQYDSRYSGRPDVCSFALGMRAHGILSTTRDGSAQGLTATSGCPR